LPGESITGVSFFEIISFNRKLELVNSFLVLKSGSTLGISFYASGICRNNPWFILIFLKFNRVRIEDKKKVEANAK